MKASVKIDIRRTSLFIVVSENLHRINCFEKAKKNTHKPKKKSEQKRSQEFPLVGSLSHSFTLRLLASIQCKPFRTSLWHSIRFDNGWVVWFGCHTCNSFRVINLHNLQKFLLFAKSWSIFLKLTWANGIECVRVRCKCMTRVRLRV